MIKLILLGLLLGATLGVSLATEIVNRIGLNPDSYLIGLGALIITALVIHRGLALIICICVLTVGVVQPEQVLINQGLDKDILLALLLTLVLYPIIYRVMHS